MPTDKKHEDQITEAGAVELEEGELDTAAGGLSLNYSKISYEYKPRTTSTTEATDDGSVHPGGVNVALGDGSVRF